MYSVRARDSTDCRKRQARILVDYAAENSFIPLKEKWGERYCTLPEHFASIMSEMLNFEVREQDVFVVTFMKCGTTWMQEAAWLLMNNLDYVRAKQSGILERSIFLDWSGLDMGAYNSIEKCNQMPNPRLIKSHLPANLLPQQVWQKKQKTIYVARNAKDAVISAYHFMKNLGYWQGDISEFVEDFMNNDIMYTPFWAHIVDFWKMRSEPFIFFVTFEEMKRDLAGVLQRLCKFLERSALTEIELSETVEHLSFKKMKANDQTNLTTMLKEITPEANEKFQFMRRGIVGSYKDELTLELQEKLNTWSADFLAKHNIKEEDIFGKV